MARISADIYSTVFIYIYDLYGLNLLLTIYARQGYQEPRDNNFSPRMPCQWYVRGGEEGKRWILIGQSVPPTPFGMAFGRLKLSPLKRIFCLRPRERGGPNEQ
jgi:hypothetical protein